MSLATLWLASVWGLLCLPLDLYDECVLLVGSRLVRAGKLPYVDFYTHYGPLGYNLMAPWLGVGNPGIAYRLAQASALCPIVVLVALFTKRVGASRVPAMAIAALCFLNFTAAIVFTHFIAYVLVAVGLGVAALAQTGFGARRTTRLWVSVGILIGLAGLVRPVFAAYAAAAVAGALLVTEDVGAATRRVAQFLAAGVGAAALIWLLAYHEIPLEDAWFATVIIPARLTGGSARFLNPALLSRGYGPEAQSVFAGLYLSVLFLLATISGVARSRRRARLAVLCGAVIALATPHILRVSGQPGRIAPWLNAGMFLAALAGVARTTKDPVRPVAKASAILGLAAVAFFHYYLARADQAHLTASLALATAAAAVALPSLPRFARGLAGFLIVLAPLPLLAGIAPFPIRWIGYSPGRANVSTARNLWSRFPASTFPVEAVAAVSEADRLADPRSRFVALASDHTRTEGSAAVLFLLSARLPYTRWYAYDPGVQSSAFVQARMVEELERSGSDVAITWSSSTFGGREPDIGAPPATPLDRRFRELYPKILDRVGGLVIRERGPGRVAPSRLLKKGVGWRVKP